MRLLRYVPLIVLAGMLLGIKREGLEHLNGGMRLLLLACIVFAVALPMFGRGRPADTTAENRALIGQLRLLWKSLLILNVFAFVGSLIAAVLLRDVVPIRYMALAPCACLLLIFVFWRQMARVDSRPRA